MKIPLLKPSHSANLLAYWDLDDVHRARQLSQASRRHLLQQLGPVREKRGLTQEVVAYRMGTSQPSVARLEAGLGNPLVSTLESAAAALGCRLVIGLEPLDDQALTHSALAA